jgi:hypothetical protein
MTGVYNKRAKELSLIYYHEHKDKELYKGQRKRYADNYFQALKARFIELYGGRCECCGESIKEFICLDHIKGVNRKYKHETGANAYIRAIREHDTTEYRILCNNCNQATRLGRICPHQLIKESL